MLKSAQDYVKDFKSGNDFKRPVIEHDLILDSLDKKTLDFLGEELETADADVRENIVRFLIFVGKRSNPHSSLVISNPKILDLLAGPGLIKSDHGQGVATDALLKYVKKSDLSHYASAFAETLSSFPGPDILLLVSKAPSVEAKPIVDRLSKQPEWINDQYVRIARAALGDKNIENEYILAVESAKHGDALTEALKSLSLIGTPRSLKLIAEQLRTPLISRPSSHSYSTRLSVLDALRYHYPDQEIFLSANIIDDTDYAKAEDFCIRHLGAVYSTPRPPFLTRIPFPMPLRK